MVAVNPFLFFWLLTMDAPVATTNGVKKNITFRRVLRLATALGALVLLLLLVWRVYTFYRLSGEEIYQKSYVPYRLATGNIDDTSAYTTIELYYAEGNYTEVVRLSRSLLSVTDRERLLIGLSFMHKEEYLPAISWLRRLADVEGTPYQQVAEYYLALTHLANKDFDRTIELMQRVVDDGDHPYHPQFTQEMIDDVRLLKWK